MAFSFNGNNPKEIYFNNQEVRNLVYNNTLVWHRKLPYEYTELEYIESYGGAYMRIDYNLKGLTEIDMQILYTNEVATSGGIMGNRAAGTSSVSSPSYVFTSSSSGISLGYYYVSSYQGISPLFNLDDGEMLRLQTKIENNKFNIYINGTLNTRTARPYTEFTCPEDTKIFGIPTRYKDQRIYYCKFYENGEAKVDLVPSRRKSDNVLGMYDLVTGTFYTNYTSNGGFTAGAEVN